MVKILLVEDDPLISRLYQKVFSLNGYEVVLAGNGEEGIAKATSENPTIILLDVMMPKMNGLQVLDHLKVDPKTKAIPVMMLTNLNGEQDAETAVKKGALKYVIKSELEPQEILDIVKEVLAKAGGQTTPPTPAPAPAA